MVTVQRPLGQQMQLRVRTRQASTLAAAAAMAAAAQRCIRIALAARRRPAPAMQAWGHQHLMVQLLMIAAAFSNSSSSKRTLYMGRSLCCQACRIRLGDRSSSGCTQGRGGKATTAAMVLACYRGLTLAVWGYWAAQAAAGSSSGTCTRSQPASWPVMILLGTLSRCESGCSRTTTSWCLVSCCKDGVWLLVVTVAVPHLVVW